MNASRCSRIGIIASLAAALLSLAASSVALAQDRPVSLPSVAIGKSVALPVEGTSTTGDAMSIEREPIRWVSDDGSRAVVNLMDGDGQTSSAVIDLATGKTTAIAFQTLTVFDGHTALYGPDNIGAFYTHDLNSGEDGRLYGAMASENEVYRYTDTGFLATYGDGAVWITDLHDPANADNLTRSTPIPQTPDDFFLSRDGKTIYTLTSTNGSTTVRSINVGDGQTVKSWTVDGLLSRGTYDNGETPDGNGIILGVLSSAEGDGRSTVRIDLVNGTVKPLSASALYDWAGNDRYRVLYEAADGGERTQAESTYDFSRKDLAAMKLVTYDVASGKKKWETRMPDLLTKTDDANLAAVKVSADGRYAFVFRAMSTDGKTNDLHVIDLKTGEESGGVNVPAESMVSAEGLMMSPDGRSMIGLTTANGGDRLTVYDITPAKAEAAASPSQSAPEPSGASASAASPSASDAPRASSGGTNSSSAPIALIAAGATTACAAAIGIAWYGLRRRDAEARGISDKTEPSPFCINCGKRSKPGMKFCTHCGKPLVPRKN